LTHCTISANFRRITAPPAHFVSHCVAVQRLLPDRPRGFTILTNFQRIIHSVDIA
jgi:hypothetical protein